MLTNKTYELIMHVISLDNPSISDLLFKQGYHYESNLVKEAFDALEKEI